MGKTHKDAKFWKFFFLIKSRIFVLNVHQIFLWISLNLKKVYKNKHELNFVFSPGKTCQIKNLITWICKSVLKLKNVEIKWYINVDQCSMAIASKAIIITSNRISAVEFTRKWNYNCSCCAACCSQSMVLDDQMIWVSVCFRIFHFGKFTISFYFRHQVFVLLAAKMLLRKLHRTPFRCNWKDLTIVAELSSQKDGS